VPILTTLEAAAFYSAKPHPFLPQPERACGGGPELVAVRSFRYWFRLAGAAPVLGGFAASWLFRFTAKPHFLLSSARPPFLLPNVRAEATREAGRPGAAQENGACDCPARRQGATPRGVASRARG
jgi:hypothetical protein